MAAAAVDAGGADGDAAQDQGGNGEDEAEERLPAVLLPLLDGDQVDGVALAAPEGRERVGGEVEVGVYVREVAEEPGLEITADRSPGEHDGEPVDHRHHGGEQSPHVQEDQVGDDEDEAEADGQAGALEIVVDDDPNLLACARLLGLRGLRGWRRRRRRRRRRLRSLAGWRDSPLLVVHAARNLAAAAERTGPRHSPGRIFEPRRARGIPARLNSHTPAPSLRPNYSAMRHTPDWNMCSCTAAIRRETLPRLRSLRRRSSSEST